MDAWTYQGIELWEDESAHLLFKRVAGLASVLGHQLGLRGVGTFVAPMTGRNPPRYNPTGQPRRFLHLTWERESDVAWSMIAHVGLRDGRALLSSFNGTGFRTRDLDVDGHPRERVLLAAFTTNAVDFDEPLAQVEPDAETQRLTWRRRLDDAAAILRGKGLPAHRIDEAVTLVERGWVRFEHGWYFDRGEWRARYLVRAPGTTPALAIAQESICTCASRRPETLQLMMPSGACVHHVAAALLDWIAESALLGAARSPRRVDAGRSKIM